MRNGAELIGEERGSQEAAKAEDKVGLACDQGSNKSSAVQQKLKAPAECENPRTPTPDYADLNARSVASWKWTVIRPHRHPLICGCKVDADSSLSGLYAIFIFLKAFMVGLKIFWVWLVGKRPSRRHQKKHLQSGFDQQNRTRLHFFLLTRDDPEVVRYSCSRPPDLIPLQAEVELEEVIFQSRSFANPISPVL